MTDRPIIFSAPMVRALLEGRKTQTRRLLKKPATMDALAVFGPAFLTLPGNVDLVGYAPGDRLYVREAHYLTDDGDEECVVYAEDEAGLAEHREAIRQMQADLRLSDEWAKPHLKLRPSIHMPRWASRLTLTVTEVRVQQLQEISAADVAAEGVEVLHYIGPISPFRDLWNSLHGPDAWDANPWVVAVSFTVRQGNIDEVAA